MASASRAGMASRAGVASARVGVASSQNGAAATSQQKPMNGAASGGSRKDSIADADAALLSHVTMMLKLVKAVLALNVVIVIFVLASIALNFIGGGGGCEEAVLKKVADEANDNLMKDIRSAFAGRASVLHGAIQRSECARNAGNHSF